MRHAGGVSTHRTADLGFARLDLDRGRPHRHARGRLRRREDARRRPWPASRPCATAARRSPGRPGWTTRRRPRCSSAGPTRSSTPRPGARSSASCPSRSASVLVLTAGTSDGAVAAEVAATLAASGVGCRRVDDVGVAGVHRVLAVAPDIADGRRRRRRRRDGRRAAQRRRRADRPAGGRRADVGRLRRRLRGAGRPADHADRLRARASLVVNIDNGFGAGVAAAARSAVRAAQR